MTEEQKYFLKSGGIFACWKPYCVATVLGSGVAVCLCDPVARVGGVSHFTLPQDETAKKSWFNPKTKSKDKRKYMTYYGENSIPHLLQMMYKMGATSRNIGAHIVGGSFDGRYSTRNVGKKNVEFAKKFLKKNKIEIVNEDTSGFWGRKLLFNTVNGEIIVYKVRNIRNSDWHGESRVVS